MGSIPGSGRFHGRGHGKPLKYSYLENPMDRGAWQATVNGVAKSQTQMKQLSTHSSRPEDCCQTNHSYPFIYDSMMQYKSPTSRI